MKSFFCEICGKEHDGTYGSGRFCSPKCRSTNNILKVKNHVCNFRKKEDLEKLHMKNISEEKWKCVHCGICFPTKRKLYAHVRDIHPEYTWIGGKRSWNRGLTKENNESIRKGAETYKRRVENGEISSWIKGKEQSEETKQKISSAMKIAHQEGRAHNIGSSRWNNEPSYPEQWFMRVIENEFEDKNYHHEYPFGRFSLDFAWIEKKKCIEIDGEQHQRFQEQIERDKRKDSLLKENDWQVMRIIWKEAYNNPKETIQKAKDFIEK